MTRGRLRRLLAALVAVGGLLLLAVALWGYRELTRPVAGWSGPEVIVRLEPGLDAGSMLSRLAQAGVLREPRLLRAWLSWNGGADRLQAGEYRFDRALSPLELVDRLQNGDVVLHPITLPEGLTLAETAERLATAGFGSTEALLLVFSEPARVRDLDPVAEDLEGYLFPDTYQFPRGESPERIADALVQRFREVIGEGFDERARRHGFDLREAVILASLIERETGIATERTRISRVFHNRLERKMRLECDPTVYYALARAGNAVERLTYADLEFESPWNTYRIHGLPVGPIANPGEESLIAAIEPADGNELYFVAAPEGGHRFSRTLDEHLAAVRAWRRHERSTR